MSHQPSGSRAPSHSSYGSSIGGGSRPPSRSSHTSYHTRSASVRSGTSKGSARPLTSMSVREEDREENKKHGTAHPHPRVRKKMDCSALPVSQTRKCRSQHDLSTLYKVPLLPDREVSLSRQLSSLSLKDREPAIGGSARERVTITGLGPMTPVRRRPTVSSHTPSARGDAAANRGSALGGSIRGNLVVPKTPSVKDMQQQASRVEWSLKKLAGSRAAPFPSPTRHPVYLTKDSNAIGFTAFDVDERLGKFESEFKAMQNMINTSISGQKSLEEDVANVRQKGKWAGRRPLFACINACCSDRARAAAERP